MVMPEMPRRISELLAHSIRKQSTDTNMTTDNKKPADSDLSAAFGSDLRIRDEDGFVINENRCDSCDGDGYHVTEIGTDYICDHCQGSGLL